jgi:site-specific DNA-methyltransferase (adenine-specific)
MEPESVDAVVTDPPYGIGFKQNRWDLQDIRDAAARAGHERLSDSEAYGVWCRLWGQQCLRVLKPGAHLLAFGSPRTAHRLACGLEDAGFELRDTLVWLYGTGLPKSRRLPGGRGTTLKPAYEPILLARRPPAGTVQDTIARHGTGGLNIDACRIERRHPANVIASHATGCTAERCEPDCAAALIDSGADRSRARSGPQVQASRLFYCPKVSRRERNAGCEHLPAGPLELFPNADREQRRTRPARNPHPTVKPLVLMRWLVRLACPPGGLVLDPFCGSGSTGAAAVLEQRGFVGLEIDRGYARIARARIAHWARHAGRETEPVPFDRRRQ